jgi:hypothetical protein
MALICRFQGSAFGPIFKLCLMAYVSHLALDFFGPDGRVPYGNPLFWPFSSAHFLSPTPLLLGARHVGSTTASTMEFIKGALSLYNVAAMTLEIVVVGPFICLGQHFRRARDRRN